MYCPTCGAQNEVTSNNCTSCGASLATTTTATVVPATNYASFGERFVAWLIDTVILAVAAFVLRIGHVFFFTTPLFWAYGIFFLGSHKHATLGKQAMHLKVVKTNGAPCDYGTAALREIVGKFVSGIILGIGYLFPLWDPQKQALHDKIASTLVFKE
jgi:uncharacterized RDD family membrane protein YckC